MVITDIDFERQVQPFRQAILGRLAILALILTPMVVAAAVTTISGGPLIPMGAAFACAVLMLAIAGRVLWAAMPDGPVAPGQETRAA